MTEQSRRQNFQRDDPLQRRRFARFIDGRHASSSEQADDLEPSETVASRKQIVGPVHVGVAIPAFGTGKHLLEQTRRTQSAQR
jgi:hypothetical protein